MTLAFDTIFALSSGQAPAAIGVIRISGSGAGVALSSLAGRLPPPRRASHRVLRDCAGTVLDDCIVIWFPGPRSATGEDLAEIHCHAGRAVIAAIEQALAAMPGLRAALPGEFTRRAFANGRIDLAEAEGLADLLSAETELQRQSARAMASGVFSRTVEGWRLAVLGLSGQVEAALDFSDEDDVSAPGVNLRDGIAGLVAELNDWLARPAAELLRDGFRVVLAGPPNAGKSTLFNALVESEAAITAPIAGTTRDVLVRPVAIGGVPFQFIDTAGLNLSTRDAVEAIGIERAQAAIGDADVVLWLGEEGEGPDGAWEVDPRCDERERAAKHSSRHRVSGLTGEGVDQLRADLVAHARTAMPRPGEPAINARQRALIASARAALERAATGRDLLLVAEDLRLARAQFDALTGRASTEDMLDVLFGRFCIGK